MLKGMLKGLLNKFKGKANPRDLSELFEGELEITIEGVGAMKMIFDRKQIGSHIAFVHCMLTMNMVIISDIYNAPYQIVSFDREARKLIVRSIT